MIEVQKPWSQAVMEFRAFQSFRGCVRWSSELRGLWFKSQPVKKFRSRFLFLLIGLMYFACKSAIPLKVTASLLKRRRFSNMKTIMQPVVRCFFLVFKDDPPESLHRGQSWGLRVSRPPDFGM